MSRSRKKAFVKKGSTYFRRKSHAKLRRKVKVLISQEKWETMPKLAEMELGWNIIDWRWATNPTDVREQKWWVDNTAKIINGQVYISK